MYKYRDLIILVSVAIVVRLYEYVMYGPIMVPDSDTYISYAQCLLDGTCTLGMPGSLSMLQPSLIRLAGYPLFIAMNLIIFGDWWSYSLVAIQMLCGCITVIFVYRIAELLTSKRCAFIAAIIYSISSTIMYESWVSTDFLYAFFIISTFYVILIGKSGLWRIILAGLLYTMSALIRQTGPLLLIFPMVLIYIRNKSVKSCALFAIPLIVMMLSYSIWNKVRADTWQMCPFDGYDLMDRYLDYGKFDKDDEISRLAKVAFADDQRCLTPEGRNGSDCLWILGAGIQKELDVDQIEVNRILRKMAILEYIRHPVQQIISTAKYTMAGMNMFESSMLRNVFGKKKVLEQWKQLARWTLTIGKSELTIPRSEIYWSLSKLGVRLISAFILLLNIVYFILLIFKKIVGNVPIKIVLMLFSMFVILLTSFVSYGNTRFFLPVFPFMIIFAVDCLRYIAAMKSAE